MKTKRTKRPAGTLKVVGEEFETGNKRAMRALVIGVDKVSETDASSEEILDDPFRTEYSAGKIISPPYDLRLLSMMYENSSELGQCLEAMEVNIEGFGYHLKRTVKEFRELPEATRAEVESENLRLVNWFDNVSINGESFTRLRRKTRRDIEGCGNGYWEIIPDTKNSEPNEIEVPAGLNHIPAHTMRITSADEEPVDVRTRQPYKTADGSIEMKTVTTRRRFRRYVHKRGSKNVYFKEYGDPRNLNYKTGEYETEKKKVPVKLRANPIIHFAIYSPRSPYGIPRWIGQVLSVLGSRAAEEINFKTFKSNNIPSMMILVSNGMLTDSSIDRIQEFVETQIAGDGNYSKFLLLEAESAEEEGLGSSGTMKISTEPLTKIQHTDELFQKYDQNNQDKVRRSFRLPPIFVGRAEDYTRATAESSIKVADEQVFAPERSEVDHVINYKIMPQLDAKYHRFVTNSPNTTDNKELAQILNFAEKTGGITPNIARAIISDIFGTDLGTIDPEKFDGDIPFTLTIAERVKKQDPRLNAEAIPQKVAKFLLGLDEIEKAGEVLDLSDVNELIEIKKHVEEILHNRYIEPFDEPDLDIETEKLTTT